jgi:hypothetical protein
MDYGNIFAHLFEQQLALHCMILDHHILIYCHILPYIYVLYHLQNHGRTEIPEIPEIPEIGTGTSETETGKMRLDLS